MKSRILLLLFLSVALVNTHAQVSSARTAMETLYQLYDSMPFITFDVRYSYKSDTLFNDYTHDEITGTYTMSGNKAKFSLGDVEYMQNDSFLIAVYHKDKMIIVSNASQGNAGNYMPLRASIDSLLNAYSQHYTIDVQNNPGDSVGYIRFNKADSLAMFSNFSINFDKTMNYITSLQYDFYEQPVITDSSQLGTVFDVSRRRTLRIDFLNYRFDNFSESFYDKNNYIWFEDGELKPVAKLEGYKVYDARQ